MATERITVCLEKTSGVFGDLPTGHTIHVRVPADIGGGEQEAKIRARKMMERSSPRENQMEWEATVVVAPEEEMVEAISLQVGDQLVKARVGDGGASVSYPKIKSMDVDGSYIHLCFEEGGPPITVFLHDEIRRLKR